MGRKATRRWSARRKATPAGGDSAKKEAELERSSERRGSSILRMEKAKKIIKQNSYWKKREGEFSTERK